jgi:hypothetical protein
MKWFRMRFTIRGMLLVIAIVAVLLACFGVLGAVEFVALDTIAFVPIATSPRRTRLRVSAWVASFYPVLILLSFYALWVFTWGFLGHRPRPTLDNPVHILGHSSDLEGPFFLLITLVLASPLSFIACMILPVVSIETGQSGGRSTAREFAPLWTLPIAWLSVFAILLCDPIGVFHWFLG